jgi:TonB-dependent starch-binding outer membrane protein SusC
MRHKVFVGLLAALLVPYAALAQTTGQVTGVVVGEMDAPLVTVSISVAGLQLQAVTDSDGRYTLTNVPAGVQQIEANRIGYGTVGRSVTVVAGQTVEVNFSMDPRAIALQEIVAVGYGTQRREEITSAVASITADRLIPGPSQNTASLIAGQLPGLAVSVNSGDPRATPDIQLRGRTSVGGTSPLVVIDGVPGDLRTVAAEDIESISVLKDGAAAAIYGSRASDGVILITTRRHQGVAPTFRYSGYASYSTINQRPDFLTAQDWRDLASDGTIPFRIITDGNGNDAGYSTDWMGLLLRNPMSYRHSITASGGDGTTNYLASLNFDDTQGIFHRSDNQETTARANIGHSMFDGRLQADVNMHTRTRQYFNGPGMNGIWRQAMIRNPTDRIYDDEGEWQEREEYMYNNPLGLLYEHNGGVEQRHSRLHGSVTFRPLNNLNFTVLGGTTRASSNSGHARTFRHVNSREGASRGTANRSMSSDVDRIFELTGTYSHRLGAHNLNFLGGYTYNDYETESFSLSNSDFDTDLYSYWAPGTGNALGEGRAGMGGGKSDRKLAGFFGRVNHSWDNRFNAMVSLRYEGDSRFGANHQWAAFPAISAGWRLSEESLFQGYDFLDDLRIRVGYGVTGIAPSGSYGSLASYQYSNARFLYQGNWIRALVPARNANPDLRWEEKVETNIGLEFGLFDRMSATIDVYRRDTNDMLYNYSVPVPPNVTNSITANVGKMRNQGIEMELNYDLVSRPGLSWTTSANWSRNSNRLLTLSDEIFEGPNWINSGHTGEPIQTSTHRTHIGGPVGDFWIYKSVDIDDNGVWIIETPAVYDDAGNLLEEPQHISIRDATADHRQAVGNGVPRHFLAWNNMARIGNFDLTVNMRGAFGYQILNFNRMYYENPGIYHYNMLRSAFDPVYGRHDAEGNPINVNYDLAYVSYYLEDGDHWKLDNATLGYTFGGGQLGPLSGMLSNARVYISGRNLLTLTGYKGLDPEVSFSGFSPGTDHRDQYPTTRLFTTGVNVTF